MNTTEARQTIQKRYREKNKERLAAKAKEYRRNNRERLLAYAREYREQHREEAVAYQRKYNQSEAHKEALKQYRQKPEVRAKESAAQIARYHAMTPEQKAAWTAQKVVYNRERRKSPEVKEAHRQWHKGWYRLAREEVIQHYGGKCSCCGETQYEFLSLDHVNNDGHKHKKVGVTAHTLHQWAKNNGYPDTLQVLCYNCNCAKGVYGACPHQTTNKLMVDVGE